MELSRRLSAIEGQVRRGSRVADIGTDHAYLPIHMMQSGLCERVIACDLRAGPLQTAQKNVTASGAAGIELRLGDGLAPVQPHEIDTAIIAGMGGEIIAGIIAAAPFVKKQPLRLILQPMSRAEDLWRYLSENGFQIENELAVADAGRVYPVITAVYTGATGCYAPFELYIGQLRGKTPDEREYILRQLTWLQGLQADLSRVPRKAAQAAQLAQVLPEIENIVKEFAKHV